MARECSPERDKAKRMWMEGGGTMKLKNIAAALSIYRQDIGPEESAPVGTNSHSSLLSRSDDFSTWSGKYKLFIKTFCSTCN
ncbi:phage terminase small subunit-related protein [Paenibacillus sanguinis]|uniref:phage terminase small subunit-related protein n=1 Tax=Paenibacillus sanguinis TaxID=225906 RepID=UPI00036721EC|nr:phage terminase small subunit-related protein [Paenibacillus sanguinis]